MSYRQVRNHIFTGSHVPATMLAYIASIGKAYK
jgi:hypothetical protein